MTLEEKTTKLSSELKESVKEEDGDFKYSGKFSEILTTEEILKFNFGDRKKWLIENFLPMEGVMILSADPGSYKSFLMLYFALCVARGNPIFGKFETEKGKVLIVDEESTIRLLQERLQSLHAQDDEILFCVGRGVKVDDLKDIERIVDLVKSKEIKLVIFDAFVRLHEKDENDAGQMSRIANGIKPILRQGASIIFIHHHGKSSHRSSLQKLRGSSEILAFVNSHFLIEKIQDKVFRLVNSKMRDALQLEDMEIQVVLSDGSVEFQLQEGVSGLGSKTRPEQTQIKLLLANQKDKLDVVQIRQLLGSDIGDAKLRSILNYLVEEGLISRETVGENRKLYSIDPGKDLGPTSSEPVL